MAYTGLTALSRDQRSNRYVRQQKILLPETERELFHHREDGDTGKRTGRAFVFQPAAENVPDVAET